MGEKVSLNPGFTLRSFLAIFTAASLLLPVSIYLQLTSGALLAGAVTYITAILFAEISRLLGKPLTKQEIFIIFQAAAPVLLGTPFLEFVYRRYFLNSPAATSFSDPYTGKTLASVLPSWWVARYSGIDVAARTFLREEWATPISVYVLQIVFWLVQEVALTYMMAYVYIEEERLPFPFAEFPAQMSITLAEREEESMRIFTASAIIGAIYSVILYAVPMVSLGLFNTPVVIIPVPWYDLTAGPYGIENILPGAIFGVATDPLTYVGAFLIPFHTVMYMVAGSLSVWVFGNYITRTYFSNIFVEWSSEWIRGMALPLVYQRSFLRLWITPFIGFAFAATAYAIAKGRRSIILSFKSLYRLSTDMRLKGYKPLRIIVLLYLIGVLGSIAIFHALVPGFPIVIAVLVAMAGGFLYSVIATRSIGETGYMISMPYLWQISVLASGYPEVDAWLIFPMFSGVTPTASQLGLPFTASPHWCNTIKAAFLTETRPSDFFKAYFMAISLYFIFSFIYVSFFWSIAPIPSQLYPITTIQWPVSATSSALWISKQISLKVDAIIYSFALMTAVSLAGDAISKFVGIPFSPIGLVTGVSLLPPQAISLLIGGIAGRVISNMKGRGWWYKNRGIMMAGVATGEALAVGVSTSIVMLSKATWILPW